MDMVKRFRELHESGCFVIPNPWDPGSARYLAQLGFKAVATTSSGFAFSRALSDGAVPLDAMLQHFREIVQAVEIPGEAPRYELAGKGHHHHFYCSNCGKSYDLPANSMLETMVDSMASKAGFSPRGHQIEIFGLCPNCLSSKV